MKKLIGLKKAKVAVFISGTGSNLKNLIKFSNKKNSPISINLIISNTKKAKGLKYANQYNIEKKVLNFNNNNINEISMGSGNKTIQYGFGYAACIGITSYIWYKIILIKHKRGESVNFSIPYYLGFFGTPLFGLIGITDGVMISTKFEDPILVNNIEWEIVN